jgi:hypothetical protein
MAAGEFYGGSRQPPDTHAPSPVFGSDMATIARTIPGIQLKFRWWAAGGDLPFVEGIAPLALRPSSDGLHAEKCQGRG